MRLTRDFKELLQMRIARDPTFADALLREGIDTMLAGDVDTGKAILRDYIKATGPVRATLYRLKTSDDRPMPDAHRIENELAGGHRLSSKRAKSPVPDPSHAYVPISSLCHICAGDLYVTPVAN
jgi:hypothetical protein